MMLLVLNSNKIITMEDNQINDNDLIAGIEKSAHAEADMIINEAEKVVNERRAAAESQVANILKGAQQKSQVQADKIKKNMDSVIATETRRNSLKVHEQIINITLDKVREKLESFIETSDYRQILISWIVEAAIGLNEPEVEVNASAREMAVIDDNLLGETEEKLYEITGLRVKMKKSNNDPLHAQGVVLKSKSGRTAFSNQVSTRILRYQSEIRKIIYK